VLELGLWSAASFVCVCFVSAVAFCHRQNGARRKLSAADHDLVRLRNLGS
jgi:hypothetical protein